MLDYITDLIVEDPMIVVSTILGFVIGFFPTIVNYFHFKGNTETATIDFKVNKILYDLLTKRNNELIDNFRLEFKNILLQEIELKTIETIKSEIKIIMNEIHSLILKQEKRLLQKIRQEVEEKVSAVLKKKKII